MAQFWVEAGDSGATYDEDGALTDSMSDSYVTAVEENATQYLSVLDSTAGASDLTLDCLSNLTLNSSKIDGLALQDDISEENNADLANPDVVVFSKEGSDDLFGIQTTQDEEGNIYRYQFQFRTNEEGQLEAIPETIQLLADVEEEQEGEAVQNVNLKLEQGADDENDEDNVNKIEIATENAEEHEFDEEIDSKEAILHTLHNQNNVEKDAIHSTKPIYQDYNVNQDEFYSESTANVVEETENETQHYESIFVQENYVINNQNVDEDISEEAEDPDEVPELEEQFPEVETILHESTAAKSNVLTVENNNGQKPPVQIYYVMQNQNQSPNQQLQRCEKENLVRSFVKRVPAQPAPNPRSLLKVARPIQPRPLPNNLPANSFIKKEEMDCGILEKRFARSKEAIQARQFQNFINRTTILQPPVRHQRQPRKQIIQPVKNRDDEEIIVKEVMVSSEGFVEDLAKTKNAKCVEFIELSDDEDESGAGKDGNGSDSEISVIEIDSDGEKPKKGRGRPKKAVDPVEDSPVKRRRGRPSKSSVADENSPKKSRTEDKNDKNDDKNYIQNDKNVGDGNEKIAKPEIEEIAKDLEKEIVLSVEKKEIKCPHCIKTFPSENSLNTHIQHHNLENSLRSQRPRIEFKHRCTKCQTVFKNTILLQRHHCPVSVSETSNSKKAEGIKKLEESNAKLANSDRKMSFDCGVCKKQFPTCDSLQAHKKVHIKQNLVKTTTTVKVSPRKSKFLKPPPPPPALKKPPSRFSTASTIPGRKKDEMTRKITRQSTNISSFRCKECNSVFSNQINLTAHQKIHKKFNCPSCSQSFPSRILLDTHLRGSCVKAKTTRSRRLSLTVRRSIVQSPKLGKRMSVRRSTALMVPCDMCAQKFVSFEAMFKHKVQEHNLATPDKSFLANAPTASTRRAALEKNCGIPSSSRIAKAQMQLKKSLMQALAPSAGPSTSK